MNGNCSSNIPSPLPSLNYHIYDCLQFFLKHSPAKVMHLPGSLQNRLSVHRVKFKYFGLLFICLFNLSVTQLFHFISPCVFLLPSLTENHQLCQSLLSISHLSASAHTENAFFLISSTLKVHSADVFSVNHFLIYLHKTNPPSTSSYTLISIYHLGIFIFQLQFYFIFCLFTTQHVKDYKENRM